MLMFTVDPRSSVPVVNPCNSCCCQQAYAKPGETNPWMINYAPWVANMSGPGLVPTPSFEITKLTSVAPGGTNLPPVNRDYSFIGTIDTEIDGVVSTNAVDPEAQALSYELVNLYGPFNGSLQFNPNGTFTYTPFPSFTGYDSFFFKTKDGVNAPVINKVQLTVNPTAPTPALVAPPVIPLVHVPRNKVQVRTPVITFPLEISPAAVTGDIWRMTVRAPAMDCDGSNFYHVACWDITIGKC